MFHLQNIVGNWLIRGLAICTALSLLGGNGGHWGIGRTGFAAAQAGEPVLVAHWPLEVDAREATGAGLHAAVFGVTFDDGKTADDPSPPGDRDARADGNPPATAVRRAARFDGVDDYIEVPHSALLAPGSEPLSISVWVEPAAELDDNLGHVLSKFDPDARRGFELAIRTDATTSHQPNHRQVAFSVDDGRIESTWTDHGRPGRSLYVMALASHDGALYAGTFEENAPGRVYRFAPPATWIDCGSPHESNSVASLAVFEGRLYAGVGDYRARGSALEESTVRQPGGYVFRYEGGQQWSACGRIGGVDKIAALVEFRGALYATSTYSPLLARWDGQDRWSDCGHAGRRVNALARFNGGLLATTYDGSGDLPGGHVNRFDGQEWTSCGLLPNVTQTYSFAVYEGQLYVGTWPEGRVFRYEGGHDWSDCGRLGDEKEVMGMLVFNGKLYAGSLPSADVYRYDGPHRWTNVGQTDTTPDVTYRRAWSLAAHRGRLFCGTLPAGRVYSLSAGCLALDERELPRGWHHLVAVREADRLLLYVDGRQAAVEPLAGAAWELSTDRPLRIGRGSTDYYYGRLRDLRWYRGALSAATIAELHADGF